MAEWILWLSVAGALYTYLGYPIVLSLLVRLKSKPTDVAGVDDDQLPVVSMIVPVHNEQEVLESKISNSRDLLYPDGKLRVIFVSDGSTDETAAIVSGNLDDRIALIALPTRQGKAAALNAALARIDSPVVVFSDASIILAPDAVKAVVRPLALPEIGCVSGEDRIAGWGGEGLYGRYELFLRRKESELHSIVGASGSFYAQRRTLCEPFEPGLAPDFLSVLRTVERGYRAVTQPDAVGYMQALDSVSDEFRRKVRTILRGLTTLKHCSHLLNPFRSGVFAFELWSHKLLRWLVPFFLLAILASSAWLALDSIFYRMLLIIQVVLYSLALAGPRLKGSALASLAVTKIAVYFTTVNIATLWAWGKYLAGARQELWQPSRR
jgi:cellulose synthase/poly-beta-1,6-N-acetylglucosamine synthase-like glycosyltransferase